MGLLAFYTVAIFKSATHQYVTRSPKSSHF